MPRIKATFANQQGGLLSGLLETPDEMTMAYALFAHCFTCSKDVAAASRITRALSKKGIAVLRFDFTGLGNSDGDFANTDFSSNLSDLNAAAKYLEENYTAPVMLIGHSLGGAAVLAAAQSIPSVKTVVTIGAPATANHVEHLFANVKKDIIKNDEAIVDLEGRKFTIKKQFLNDISSHNSTEHISKLGKALLIFHSPVDNIVPIEEAAKIYSSARHPKSFISLDKADHLLSRREDSEYVADIIASWAGRYLGITKLEEERSSGTSPEVKSGHVLITERNQLFTRRIYAENHQFIADEPLAYGGTNLGPNPYEYLLAALGACTSMTIRMYANRKNINLKNVEIILNHSRIHAEDCTECESQSGFVDKIEKSIKVEGDLCEEEKQKLLEIGNKCPVHKTLTNEILIKSVIS